MSPNLKRLQTAYDFIITAVANRPYGMALFPIALRLEREIAQGNPLMSGYERIRTLAAKKTVR
jgi:hypothetical protein